MQAYQREPLTTGADDLVRIAEKRYKVPPTGTRADKRKGLFNSPPEDLSDVIDFHFPERNTAANAARIVGVPRSANDGWPDACRVFGLAGVPGFFLVTHCLLPEEQIAWSLRCVQDFSLLPYTNLSNLHGPQPDHWAAAVRSGELAAMRRLRWSNLGFSYDWSTRQYPVFGPPPQPQGEGMQTAARPLADVPGTTTLRATPAAQMELQSGFPADLGALGSRLAALVGMEFTPESGICNYYSSLTTAMGAHVDDAEHDLSKPVVGLCFGCTGLFLLGGRTRQDAPVAFYVRSGDALIMGGPVRTAYHGVPRILAEPAGVAAFDAAIDAAQQRPDGRFAAVTPAEWALLRQYMATCRLNINMRQVRDLAALRRAAQAALETPPLDAAAVVLTELDETSPADLAAARALWHEYANFMQLEMGIPLAFQGFQAEVTGLPGAYSRAAGGCLVLARSAAGSVVGGCALRRLDAGTVEVKRLFVTAAARGHRLGQRLLAHVLAAARALGAARVCLDTVARLRAASALYLQMGFEPTEPYCENPFDDAQWFALSLAP